MCHQALNLLLRKIFNELIFGFTGDLEKSNVGSDGKEECQSCKKRYSMLLKHIAKSEDCENFYGPKFEAMKREKNRIKKQRYRARHGNERERQRYLANPIKKR